MWACDPAAKHPPRPPAPTLLLLPLPLTNGNMAGRQQEGAATPPQERHDASTPTPPEGGEEVLGVAATLPTATASGPPAAQRVSRPAALAPRPPPLAMPPSAASAGAASGGGGGNCGSNGGAGDERSRYVREALRADAARKVLVQKLTTMNLDEEGSSESEDEMTVLEDEAQEVRGGATWWTHSVIQFGPGGWSSHSLKWAIKCHLSIVLLLLSPS